MTAAMRQRCGGRSGRLEGRIALVINVGSPLTRETAATFAREGAQVFVVGRDELSVEQTLAEINGDGGSAYGLATDFLAESGIRQIVEECASRWGRLDILFNGHAAMDFWEFGEETADDWATIMHVNVIAPAMATKAVLPLLKASNVGSVMFLGSIDGYRGMPENPGYSASKGALIPLTHCLAHTYGPDGIRFNYIATAAILHTGPNDLQRSAWLDEGAMELVASRQLHATPLRRMSRPEDVASVALFFASDDSSYVTGATLTVDGGRTAYTPMSYPQRSEGSVGSPAKIDPS